MPVRLTPAQARALGIAVPKPRNREARQAKARVVEASASTAILGTQGPWTVVIPDWHPPSLNRMLGVHWAKRDRWKKTATDLVTYYCSGIPRAIGKRRVTQIRTRTGQDKVVDDDNAHKVMLDALVTAGMLVDDSPEWVETNPLVQERGVRRATTIVLEDV